MPFDFQSSSHGTRRRRLPYPSRQGPRSRRRAGQPRAGSAGCADARPASSVRSIRRSGGRAATRTARAAGKGSGRFNARGRGAATALTLKDRSAWSRDGSGVRTRARRVAVKARVVKLNPQRGARPRTAVRQRQGGGRAPALSRTGRRDEGWREGPGLFGRARCGGWPRLPRPGPR